MKQIPSTTLLGRIMRLPLRLVPPNAVITVRKGLNKGMKWVAGASTHGCWLGIYESDKQSAIRKFVSPGMHVFDIGANAGFYTLAFSRLCGAKGSVWAFEPFAANVSNLLHHVKLNGLANVTVIQAAVTDRKGLVGFRISESNAMGAVSETAEAYKVPTIHLDDFISEFAVPVPDLIKLDVEGAESMVLEGARNLLAQRKTALFVALHGEQQVRRCTEILRAAGYDIFLLSGERVVDPQFVGDEIYAIPARSASIDEGAIA